ncbi:hypothetical protein Ciccas_012364 [Cichlidogyrus casuarinus]|uniref:Uncharacterized protein n=1 Tax=Cichlidogyrus casuarinus TaxID=1844966 RepID=A0ABD2PNL7_9PLAT
MLSELKLYWQEDINQKRVFYQFRRVVDEYNRSLFVQGEFNASDEFKFSVSVPGYKSEHIASFVIIIRMVAMDSQLIHLFTQKPVLVGAGKVSVREGASVEITSTHLKVIENSCEDTPLGKFSLIFTLATFPRHGQLYLNDQPVNHGAQFSLKELRDKRIRFSYKHDDSETAFDNFKLELSCQRSGKVGIEEMFTRCGQLNRLGQIVKLDFDLLVLPKNDNPPRIKLGRNRLSVMAHSLTKLDRNWLHISDLDTNDTQNFRVMLRNRHLWLPEDEVGYLCHCSNCLKVDSIPAGMLQDGSACYRHANCLNDYDLIVSDGAHSAADAISVNLSEPIMSIGKLAAVETAGFPLNVVFDVTTFYISNRVNEDLLLALQVRQDVEASARDIRVAVQSWPRWGQLLSSNARIAHLLQVHSAEFELTYEDLLDLHLVYCPNSTQALLHQMDRFELAVSSPRLKEQRVEFRVLLSAAQVSSRERLKRVDDQVDISLPFEESVSLLRVLSLRGLSADAGSVLYFNLKSFPTAGRVVLVGAAHPLEIAVSRFRMEDLLAERLVYRPQTKFISGDSFVLEVVFGTLDCEAYVASEIRVKITFTGALIRNHWGMTVTSGNRSIAYDELRGSADQATIIYEDEDNCRPHVQRPLTLYSLLRAPKKGDLFSKR